MVIVDNACIEPYHMHIENDLYTLGIPNGEDEFGNPTLKEQKVFNSIDKAFNYLAINAITRSNAESILDTQELTEIYEEIKEILETQIKI